LAGATERRKADLASAVQFALVPIDGKIASEVDRFYQPDTVALPAAFRSDPGFGSIGVGDLLRVTIWEAGGAASNLFSREGKGSGTEVSVRVNADGMISIPYAGRIPVSGRSIAAVERAIEEQIKAQAVEPRVTILVVEPVSGSISVQGEVAKPGLVPLVKPDARILDAVALAGGAKNPPYETGVRLTRGRATINLGLQAVIDQPDMYNVKVGGGDTVLLTRVVRKFVALGAVLKPGDQLFMKDALSLSDALGQVFGLESQHADAKAIYIFRREPVDLAQRCGIGLSAGRTDAVPVVYQLDLKDPKSFFILGSFPIRPNDIVYVSTAPLADLSKFMQILSGGTSAVAIPRTLFGGYPSGR